MGTMINRRRVCGGKKGLLPSGYKQLEYIENTSNAYIDTGIDVSTLDYDIIMYGGTNKAFGYIHNDVPHGTFICSYYYNNSLAYAYHTFPFLYLNQHSESSVVKYSMKNGLYVDGDLVISFTCSKGSDNITSNTPFLIGGLYDFKIEGLSMTPRPGTIKKVDIIRNGMKVRDFIPCKDPNNVVGMYDIVNGVFYSSPNGAAFVAGPEV